MSYSKCHIHFFLKENINFFFVFFPFLLSFYFLLRGNRDHFQISFPLCFQWKTHIKKKKKSKNCQIVPQKKKFPWPILLQYYCTFKSLLTNLRDSKFHLFFSEIFFLWMWIPFLSEMYIHHRVSELPEKLAARKLRENNKNSQNHNDHFSNSFWEGLIPTNLSDV